MKKSLLALFIASVFLTPVLALAQTSPIGQQANSTCLSDGQICPTGTCRAIPEWKTEDGGTGFYCAPAGTPGVTSPGAGGGGSDIKSIQGSGPSTGSGVNDSYLRYYRDAIIWAINNVLLPVVISIAFIVFIWGVYQYFILGATNEDKRAEGRQLVLWGVIGFVIIFTVWGLVNIVTATLGLRAGGSSPDIPTIGTQGGKGSTIPSSRSGGGGGSGAGSGSGGAGIGCKDKCALNYDVNATGYVGCEYGDTSHLCADRAADNYNSCGAGYNSCEYGGSADTQTGASPEGGSGTQSPTDTDSAETTPLQDQDDVQGTEI